VGGKGKKTGNKKSKKERNEKEHEIIWGIQGEKGVDLEGEL